LIGATTSVAPAAHPAAEVSATATTPTHDVKLRFKLKAEKKKKKKIDPNDPNGDAAFCKVVMDTVFGAGVISVPATLTPEKALACMCLWNKATSVSALTAAVFEFYQPIPTATTFAAIAKDFLKAAYKAYGKATTQGQTNMIGRAFTAAYNRSPVTLCFEGDTMCDVLTDPNSCKLWECHKGTNGDLWIRNPVNNCARGGITCGDGCLNNAADKCPGGKCCCVKGTLVDSCTCVNKMGAVAGGYCKSTGTLVNC